MSTQQTFAPDEIQRIRGKSRKEKPWVLWIYFGSFQPKWWKWGKYQSESVARKAGEKNSFRNLKGYRFEVRHHDEDGPT